MAFLKNKRVLLVGVLNNRSIAYGIAKSMLREGAELAFTYQSERVKDRVMEIAEECGSKLCFPCDLGDDAQINAVFTELAKHWDGLDVIVHSAAYAPADQLEGNYVDNVTREGFRIAHDISSYSFAALAKAGHAMLKGRNGSLLALTYLGAIRTIPCYNVMGVAKASLEANMRYLATALGPEGIRVNALSAGPIRTLAASGVKDFRKMLSYYEKITPLRRNVTIEQAGDAAAFLCSDLAAGVTGQVLYVDSGFHIVGMAESMMD
ncbi:MAG: enoyl-[acyl-carrier-protein] reductase [Gammaproteobacteria bacterium GWE2_37_16]|nr:MAG: enoyl-[acyl-carrier-protein] reductase [Gammaproteobacteria bacterium GWE2_37_16]